VSFRTCSGHLFQAFDRAVDEVVVHGDLERDLSQQVGFVLVTAIRFELATLPGLLRDSFALAHNPSRGTPAALVLLIIKHKR
jgi:hypothetical protein